jgi:hypothetical protein
MFQAWHINVPPSECTGICARLPAEPIGKASSFLQSALWRWLGSWPDLVLWLTAANFKAPKLIILPLMEGAIKLGALFY